MNGTIGNILCFVMGLAGGFGFAYYAPIKHTSSYVHSAPCESQDAIDVCVSSDGGTLSWGTMARPCFGRITKICPLNLDEEEHPRKEREHPQPQTNSDRPESAMGLYLRNRQIDILMRDANATAADPLVMCPDGKVDCVPDRLTFQVQ